jgi:hypothetical protein
MLVLDTRTKLPGHVTLKTQPTANKDDVVVVAVQLDVTIEEDKKAGDTKQVAKTASVVVANKTSPRTHAR